MIGMASLGCPAQCSDRPCAAVLGVARRCAARQGLFSVAHLGDRVRRDAKQHGTALLCLVLLGVAMRGNGFLASCAFQRVRMAMRKHQPGDAVRCPAR